MNMTQEDYAIHTEMLSAFTFIQRKLPLVGNRIPFFPAHAPLKP